MKKLLLLGIAAFLFLSCASMSLNSPRPLEPGKLGVGLHGGGLLMKRVQAKDSDVENPPIVIDGTVRYGLPGGFELGGNAGMLGCEGDLKYGFFDPAAPFQLSLLAGLGFQYWSFLDVNGGVLTGYCFRNNLQPYVGYRHHYIPSALQFGDFIGGLEVYFSKRLALMLEMNYTLPYGTFSARRPKDGLHDIVFTEKDFQLAVVSAGLNFKF